jgi:hypothetical protein
MLDGGVARDLRHAIEQDLASVFSSRAVGG